MHKHLLHFTFLHYSIVFQDLKGVIVCWCLASPEPATAMLAEPSLQACSADAVDGHNNKSMSKCLLGRHERA